MRSPKPTPEDPKIVEAREREERRAETARTEEQQALLIGDTARRLRRFGKTPGGSGGSVPIYGPSAGGSTAFSGGGGGSSSYGGDFSAGGGGKGNSGGINQLQVY